LPGHLRRNRYCCHKDSQKTTKQYKKVSLHMYPLIKSIIAKRSLNTPVSRLGARLNAW
jgi:hypothetical protein